MARLKNVKAFERFQPSLLQQICLCGFYECLEKGITCEAPRAFSSEFKIHCEEQIHSEIVLFSSLCPVYRQGDIGTSWYTVLSGSLDVKVSETSCHQVGEEMKLSCLALPRLCRLVL